jgi:spore germination protein
MKKLGFCLLFLGSLICCGCWDQNPAERIGYILTVGIEKGVTEPLKFTYIIPVIGGSDLKMSLYEVEATIFREGRDKVRAISGGNTQAGKVQQILVSKDLAEKENLHKYFEVFERDASNPILAYVIIIDGSPSEVLGKAIKSGNIQNLPLHINYIVQGNYKISSIPITPIYRYDLKYFNGKIDNILPIIKLNNDNLEITGTAIFNKDHMVGTITNEESPLLLAMMNEFKSSNYFFTIPGPKGKDPNSKSGKGSVLIKKMASTIKLVEVNGHPQFNLSLDVDAYLDEYMWDNMDDWESDAWLASVLENETKKRCEYILAYLKAKKSDPIGLQQRLYAKYVRKNPDLDWRQLYIQTPIAVNVKVDVKGYGVIR